MFTSHHFISVLQGLMARGDFQDPLVASLETVDLGRLSESFSFQMDSVVPFFCGESEDCRTLGSQTALRRAETNIREKVWCRLFRSSVM